MTNDFVPEPGKQHFKFEGWDPAEFGVYFYLTTHLLPP